jgi:hypothetical protein
MEWVLLFQVMLEIKLLKFFILQLNKSPKCEIKKKDNFELNKNNDREIYFLLKKNFFSFFFL